MLLEKAQVGFFSPFPRLHPEESAAARWSYCAVKPKGYHY